MGVVRAGSETIVIPLSVVIPAYNRAAMLRRALSSVDRQRSFTPAEVIVVDDCSTDNTGAVAEAMGAHVVRTPRNLGEGGARNAGLEAASQEWVALLDSDDEWLDTLLEVLWPLRHGRVLVSGSCVAHGDGKSRFEGVPGRAAQVLHSPADLVAVGNFVTASGVMIPRQRIADVGGYDPSLKWAADFDLWVRLLERGTGVVSPEIVTIYHVHSGQVTADKASARRGFFAVCETYADRPWSSSWLLARAKGVGLWDAFREAVRERHLQDAVKLFATICRSPGMVAGVVGILVRRWRLRRQGPRVSAVIRDTC
jgi:glycosyltransferase involved in cell wall biosynthesis